MGTATTEGSDSRRGSGWTLNNRRLSLPQREVRQPARQQSRLLAVAAAATLLRRQAHVTLMLRGKNPITLFNLVYFYSKIIN